MKSFLLIIAIILFASCSNQNEKTGHLNLTGTWKLLAATTITKGVSTQTDYTKNQQMIKIINDTHFAFLKHDVQSARDSSNHFDGGGGRYTLRGNQYTEQLDYYAGKNWEGKSFSFTITLSGDTLIQKGLEKVESENINRIIIEKYLRIK